MVYPLGYDPFFGVSLVESGHTGFAAQQQQTRQSEPPQKLGTPLRKMPKHREFLVDKHLFMDFLTPNTRTNPTK